MDENTNGFILKKRNNSRKENDHHHFSNSRDSSRDNFGRIVNN